MSVIKSLKENFTSNQLYDSQMAYAKKIARRWEKLGLLEGIQDKHKKYNTALLLENEAKHLIKQASYTSSTPAHEEWSGIALPLVRRFLNKIYAQEWVSIQTMTRPSGLVFFIDHQFGSTKAGRTAGESIYGTAWKGTPGTTQYTMGTDLAKGLYGEGKYGYSLNNVAVTLSKYVAQTVESGSTIPEVPGYKFESIAKTQSHYWNHDNRFIDIVGGTNSFGSNKKIKKVSINNSLFTPNKPDLNAFSAFNFNLTLPGSETYKIYPHLTFLKDNTINFIIECSGDVTESAVTGSMVVNYYRQNQPHDRGDFEWKGGTGSLNIPEVTFELTQKPIVAQTRKLKARWTQELIDDLNAYLAIDGQAEISNQLSDQIALQTDLEILSMLRQGARESGNAAFWSAKIGTEASVSGDTVTFNTVSGGVVVQNKSEWFQNIKIPMQRVSNLISQKTGRGGANFAIVNSTIATILETIEGFTAETDGTKDFFDAGFKSIGSYRNRFKIYKNPYDVDGNQMILGYRGTGIMDFGAVYAPFIPLVMLPMIYEPENFVPTKGVYTRYAKTMLRNDYYGVVLVEGLETV